MAPTRVHNVSSFEGLLISITLVIITYEVMIDVGGDTLVNEKSILKLAELSTQPAV
jgi:hypothetical protein